MPRLSAGEPLLARLAHAGAQPPQVRARVLARELGECLVVLEQAQPPALDAVMRGGRFSRLTVPALDFARDRHRVDLAHELADVLQLAAMALAAADALRLEHRVAQI